MFAITGGLYTFKITGQYDTRKLSLPLALPAEPKLSELISAAESVLREHNNGVMPTGNQAIKRAGTSWQFEWTGSNYDFVLEPTTEAGVFSASIKKTTLHRFFVQLHKAKGGLPFKILAAGVAIGLVVLFLGGVLIALSSPKLKQQLFMSFALGAAAFIVAALLS